MHAPYSRIPAVPVTVGFMAGILLYGAGLQWYWIATLTLAAASLLYFPRRFYTFGALAVGVGWLCAASQAVPPLPESLHGTRQRLSAEVLRINPSGDYYRLLVAADSIGGIGIDSPVRVWLTVLGDVDDAGIGSRITAEGYLRDCGKFDGLPYETDYGAYAAVDRVSAMITVGEGDFAVHSPGGGFYEHMRQYRLRLADAIYLSGLSQRTADFIVATVVGDDNNLSYEAREMFRTLGLAHLLAISGFHVALFAGLMSLLLYPFRVWRGFARWRHLAVIAAVWLYVPVSGMSPSAVRAALMLTVVLSGRMMLRPGVAYNTLAVAALLMLTWNPSLLYSPGFQLSFAAVLGLLAFGRRLNPVNPRRRVPHMLVSLIAVPLAAVLGTALISTGYFHSFPLLFLPANAVVSLPASILIGGGMLLGVLSVCGVGCRALAWVLDGLYSLTERYCGLLMNIPVKEIDGLYPATATLLLLAVSVVLLAVALERRRHVYWISAILFVLLAAGAQSLSAENEPRGELYIPHHTAGTRLIMRHGTEATLLADEPLALRPAILADCNRRYRDWLRIRRCHNGLTPADSCRLVHAGPYSLWLPRNSADILPLKVDYVVLGCNSNLDFAELAAQMQPRTVVLTSGLSRKRRLRFEHQCQKAGLAVHNAADSTFSLNW